LKSQDWERELPSPAVISSRFRSQAQSAGSFAPAVVVGAALWLLAWVFYVRDGQFRTTGLGDWMDPYFINGLLEHWLHSVADADSGFLATSMYTQDFYTGHFAVFMALPFGVVGWVERGDLRLRNTIVVDGIAEWRITATRWTDPVLPLNGDWNLALARQSGEVVRDLRCDVQMPRSSLPQVPVITVCDKLKKHCASLRMACDRMLV
jgi:hypothetical protein